MPVSVRAGAILASSHFSQQLSVGENLKIDRPVPPECDYCTSIDAMDCCPKEYAKECEILVCVDAPAPHNRNLCSRLRFGLLASSWLPSPLGIFLWSALHVMLLIVGGPVFWVLGLLTAFLIYSVFMYGLLGIMFCSIYVVYGFFAVAVDLVVLFGISIKFCWSLVGFLACHEPVAEWRGRAWLTIITWRDFKARMTDIFSAQFVPVGVPYVSGSLYQEMKDRKLKTWALWCEEVVHLHDVIAL